jgi:hypothetical protein
VAERLAAIPEVHTITGPRGICSAGWSPGPTPTCSGSLARSSPLRARSAPPP